MSVDVVRFVQHHLANSEEYAAVSSVEASLLNHLNSPEVLAKIDAANQPKISSSQVQNAFIKEALSLGFRDEAKGLFANYKNSGLRPDYFLPIGDTGIILEVERGKTTINNMDFLDFWKCHLCEHANYLFLMVPKQLIQSDKRPARNEFLTVQNHLQPFFEKQNYTNVRGLSIFGY